MKDSIKNNCVRFTFLFLAMLISNALTLALFQRFEQGTFDLEGLLNRGARDLFLLPLIWTVTAAIAFYLTRKKGKRDR